jgi:hypothetical protein
VASTFVPLAHHFLRSSLSDLRSGLDDGLAGTMRSSIRFFFAIHVFCHCLRDQVVLDDVLPSILKTNQNINPQVLPIAIRTIGLTTQQGVEISSVMFY